MRAALLTAALMALGVGVASVPAQAADIYGPPPAYGAVAACLSPRASAGRVRDAASGLRSPAGRGLWPAARRDRGAGRAGLHRAAAGLSAGLRIRAGRPPALSRLLVRMGSAPLRACARSDGNIAGSRNASARACVALRGGTEKPTCVDCCSPARPLRRSPRFRASPPRKSILPIVIRRRRRRGPPAGGRRADGREPGLSRARHHLCAARHRMGRPADHHRGPALLSRLLVGLGPAALRAETLVVKPRAASVHVAGRDAGALVLAAFRLAALDLADQLIDLGAAPAFRRAADVRHALIEIGLGGGEAGEGQPHV